MSENNDKEISGLDDFFDDDPTDELPVLDLQALDPRLADEFDNHVSEDTGERPRVNADCEFPVVEPDSSLNANQAQLPLHQMELEIQALQTKWQKIEDDVRGRDEFIEILEAELLTQKSATDDLRAKLEESTAELAKANEACARLNAENAEQLNATNQQQKLLRSVEADLLEQKATAEELREKLDESREELTNANEASAKLAAENRDQEQSTGALAERLNAAEEELHLQTAEAETLQARLDESSSSFTALSASADKLIAENQEQLRAAAQQAEHITLMQAGNVGWRTQIDDLANYIAGRKSDWDALNTEVALQRQVNLGLQQAVMAKTETLTLQKQENSALLAEIDQQRRESARLHSALSTEEHTLAEEQALRRKLQDKLAARVEHTNALETASAELMKVTSSQRIMKDQLDEKNREIDRLNQALADHETEHAETATALKKQQEVIQHIENEVRSKLEAITVIGQNTKTSKSASIHRLDVIRSKNTAGRRTKREKKANRFIVTLNDQQRKEYLLEPGTITIGRGPGNDIRLRHHFISRNHAQILTDVTGSVIEDLSSKNGILVNAEPVSRRRLEDGDLVDIGEMQFKFIDPISHPVDHPAH